jgi:hypothetical protein
MEIMIKPLCDERDWKREDIIELAKESYNDWFENEKEDIGDNTIGDYIKNCLEKNGFILGKDYKMYFDAEWDRTEILL